MLSLSCSKLILEHMNKEIDFKWTSTNETEKFSWTNSLSEGKNKLSHPFSYIRKFSHTLCQKAQLTWRGEQFQTGSHFLGTSLLHCGMRLDIQQHQRELKCQYHKPLLIHSAGQEWDLKYLAACVATQSCASFCEWSHVSDIWPASASRSVREASHTCLRDKMFSWSYTRFKSLFHPHLSKKIYFLPWTISSAIFFL